jgi:5-formyltetrahydrofolate cyclo-ligase
MSEPSVKARKKQLRDKFTELRMSLGRDLALIKSKEIQNRLFDLDFFSKAEAIHTYVSMNERNEVDTHDLIRNTIRLGKQVIIPRIESGMRLSHHRIQSIDDLEKNEWGVPEPEGEADAGPGDPDLILVPMLSGDHLRNRLGYGKGFYDRFLKETKGVKVGLLFDIQISDEQLPVNDFDVPLDLLITESKIL